MHRARRSSRPDRLLLAAALLAVSSGLATADVFSTEKLKVYADFRARLEADFDSQDAGGTERDDRIRARIRARAGLRYSPDDHWTFEVRLRSGSDLSHQSPNITVVDFDDNDTGDADFNLDRWYLKGKRGGFSSWIGRNSFPFWKQNEFLWDDDATLAGVGASWSRKGASAAFAVNGGYFSLPVGMQEFSGNLAGLQLVWSRDGDTVGLTSAAGVYDVEAQPDDPDAVFLLNGNGMRDYQLLQGSVQLRLKIRQRPLVLGADYLANAENYSPTDPDPFTVANRDETDGIVGSIQYGSLNEGGQWLAGWYYARIETLATHSSYAQDDWVRWGSAIEGRNTNMKGHELHFGWALSNDAHVLARLYVVEAITTVEDGSRFRADLNYKF